MRERLTSVLDSSGKPTAESRINSLPEIGQDLVSQFTQELNSIKKEQDNIERINNAGGQGMSSLINGLGFQGPFAGAPYATNQLSQVNTLANANAYVPLSLNRILLSYSYMTQGLFRTVTCQPVDDAFRGGFRVVTPELSEDEITKLNRVMSRNRSQNDMRKIAKTIGGWVNYNACANLARSDMSALKHLAYWGRLYGGSGLVINTDQDFQKELDIEAIKEDSPLVFIPADRWELVLSNLNIFDYKNGVPYNYYGYPLHASRVVKFLWAEAPSYIRLRLQGWGMSEIEQCIRSINSFLKFENLIFELLDEAKIDVWKMKGFNTALASSNTTARVQQAITLSNQMKNFQNAIVMDREDDYDQKNLGAIFTGLASVWEQLRLNLCAALKIPKNKLFGESAGGFSSGEDALENYNSTVEALREELEPAILDVVELRCQQLFGFMPEDVDIEWQPLRVLTGNEAEDVKVKKQQRIMERFTSGLETAQEASVELKKEGLLSVDTEVLRGERDVDPIVNQGSPEAKKDKNPQAGAEKDFARKAGSAQGKKKLLASA